MAPNLGSLLPDRAPELDCSTTMLLHRLKKQINRILRSYGYRLERTVDYGEDRLEAFELAVNSLDNRDPLFFFIQVGAHDGRRGDPLFRFVERYRWRGVLLEPQPEVFKLLARNYGDQPQLILENAAIANRDGTLSMYTAPGKTLRATTNRESLVPHVKDKTAIHELQTPAVTFQTLMARHHIGRVDLLMIDTEGFDYQVVRLALDAGLRPSLIRYEHLHLSTADRQACAALLARQGYALLRDGPDTIAMNRAALDVA